MIYQIINETYLLNKTGAFHGKNARPYWMIYRHFKNMIASEKVVCKDLANIGVTEHILDEHMRIVVVINYEPELVNAELSIAKGWYITESLYGNMASVACNSGKISIAVNKNDTAVFVIKR